MIQIPTAMLQAGVKGGIGIGLGSRTWNVFTFLGRMLASALAILRCH